MIYDLHVHSNASDGALSPEEIIRLGLATGLKGLAITDHDTTVGLDPALHYIKGTNCSLEFIPGIEINTEVEHNEIHILGYFIDYKSAQLNEKLEDIRQQRAERASKMTQRLQQLGLQVDFSEVKTEAGGELIARPHLAQVLVKKHYTRSIEEAFDLYLDKGRPAFIPRYKLLPAEAMALIKEANGITVLAHPGLINDKHLIRDIIDLGIEGLEVFHPQHRSGEIADLLRLSQEKQLLVTGGSDFHGLESSESDVFLGTAGIDEVMMERIKKYYFGKF